MPDTEPTFEKEQTPMNVTELGPLHYGNPNATISYINFEKRIESGELPPTVLETAVDFITSKEGMVEVHHHDDGCIDGRCTLQVSTFKNGSEQTTEADNSNHERFKVAGGGYFTGSAMLLGALTPQVDANRQVAYTGELLSRQGIFSGAHTGEHESLEGTDCGANDKFDLILMNGLEHADSIAVNVEAIVKALGYDFESSKFSTVIEGWKRTLDTQGFFNGSNGQTRLSEVKKTLQRGEEASSAGEPVAVTKRLGGDHKEAFIVANLIEGKTFAQGKLAAQLAEAYPSVAAKELPQAFVVDFPRVVEIAKALAVETNASFEELLYAGIAYQFATAATLTDGTLRTFLVH